MSMWCLWSSDLLSSILTIILNTEYFFHHHAYSYHDWYLVVIKKHSENLIQHHFDIFLLRFLKINFEKKRILSNYFQICDDTKFKIQHYSKEILHNIFSGISNLSNTCKMGIYFRVLSFCCEIQEYWSDAFNVMWKIFKFQIVPDTVFKIWGISKEACSTRSTDSLLQMLILLF